MNVRGIVLFALALAGCPKPVKESVPELVKPPEEAVIPPAGTIVDDTWQDATYPMTLPIPRGWTAKPGQAPDEVRVALDSPDGYVHVEIAAVSGGSLEPRAHTGCTWTFTDDARYRAMKLPGTVRVATCTPEDLGAGRILAYIVAKDGVTWHVEGTVTPGHLPAGKVELDQIVGSVRLR